MKKMNNKGFSLVELIVVIAIMAVLVGVLAPQFIKYVENSRRATDVSAAESIRSAILADIADQANGYTGSGSQKEVGGADAALPSSISEQPTMKASGDDYNDQPFNVSWDAAAGTVDVWDATNTFILTTPSGAASYKNQLESSDTGYGTGTNQASCDFERTDD